MRHLPSNWHTDTCTNTHALTSALLRSYPISVLLTASKEALRSRLVGRNGPFDDFLQGILDDAFPVLEASLEDDSWDGWTIIDTTHISPIEAAALILKQF